MKTVHDRDMVAHLWANKSQDTARVASGNFWFTGPTLYSYRHSFVCAHHLDEVYSRDGRPVVLFNDDRYSMTTGRHLDAARRALSRNFVVIEVPNLDENMAHEINRGGTLRTVAAILAKMRRIADKAAAPRIKPDTRGALFAQLREMRADALHLATVDAARRDLSAERRKMARATAAELRAADVDAFAKEGSADKAGAAAFAFALNRNQWIAEMKQAAASAERYAARATSVNGPFSEMLETARQAECYAAGARELAEKAASRLPRSTVAALAKIKAGTEWRTRVEQGARAAEVEQARRDWAEGEAVTLAALESRDFNAINRALSGGFRRAFETLHGEDGDTERREYFARLESVRAAWRAQSETEQAYELKTAARDLYERGKFAEACAAARSAAHKFRRGGPSYAEAADSAEALANEADERKPEQFAAMLADWRDAKPGARFPDALAARGERGAYLRLSADRRRVETSQGAEVPARVCSHMWKLIGEVIAEGKTREFPRGAVELGHFSLDSIDEAGNVRAGCHFIPYAELRDIAARLSFTPHN